MDENHSPNDEQDGGSGAPMLLRIVTMPPLVRPESFPATGYLGGGASPDLEFWF